MEKGQTGLQNWTVVVKGGGDLGTGVVFRLHRAGLRVLVTELSSPVVIRRQVALASAVYEGVVEVEGMVGRRVERDGELDAAWEKGEVPVLVDPEASAVARIHRGYSHVGSPATTLGLS